MGTKKRVNKYPNAFRLMALERMKESVSALAEELGIHRTVLYHSKNRLKAIEGGAAEPPTLRYAVVGAKSPLSVLCGALIEANADECEVWGRNPREPVNACSLTCLGQAGAQLPISNESGPDSAYVGGDSVAVEGCL